MSITTQTLTAAICRQLQLFAVKIGRPATPHPEYYGLPCEHVDSAGGVNGPMNMPDSSAESVEAGQVWLPIGPSCC